MLVQVFYAWQLSASASWPKALRDGVVATEPYTARHGNAAFDAKASGLECRRAIEINDAALSFVTMAAWRYLGCAAAYPLKHFIKGKSRDDKDRVASIASRKLIPQQCVEQTIARSNSVVLRCSGSSRSARPQLP